MIGQETLMNFVGGHWEEAAGAQTIPVRNPATGEVIAAAPSSTATDVAKAVKAASGALQAWRRTPAGDLDSNSAVPPQAAARGRFAEIVEASRRSAGSSRPSRGGAPPRIEKWRW